MSRKVLPFTIVPKPVSARDHDYSIVVKKSASIHKTYSKAFKNENKKITEREVDRNELYELKELLIEPITTNVNVVSVMGFTFSINIPLDEVCHSHRKPEIVPIDDSDFHEELFHVSHLNDTCKVCLKDLAGSSEKISFFDEFGVLNSEVTNISTALDAMNVEVARDNKLPQQLCTDCYNNFSKIAIFKEICNRSKSALHYMRDFIVNQLENSKKGNDVDLSFGMSSEINDIMEEIEDIDEIQEMDEMVDQQRFIEEEPTFEIPPPNPKDDAIANIPNFTANNDNSYSCKKCSKTFCSKSKYTKHEQQHQSLICDFCAGVCYSKRSMHEHLKSHIIGLYPCPFCSQRFGSTMRLGIHKRNDHPNELYKCPHCPKEYKLKDTYRCHLMSHKADKPHKCTYCEKQFVFRHHWENHLRTHTKVNPFLCNFCGKSFRVEVALRAHLSIHDPKLYPYRYRLPKKPNNQKLRRCDMCDYSTTEFGSMRKHMLNFHGGRRQPGKFEFVCHICDKEFKLSASLDNHLQTHNEVRDYHCTYCKASFRRPHYLKLHIDGVHLQKRPNKCDECDAAYLISNDLKRHKMQKHSTDRPYACLRCKKKFSMPIFLKNHINRVHLNEPINSVSIS